MRCFTEMTSIVFLITCLTGISTVPFLINRHSSWREPINPYYVNTGYALAPATSANDSEQQSMSSDADTLSLTDSSVYVHIYRHKNTHRSILTTASWRNIPSESLERFNFTTPSRVNLAGFSSSKKLAASSAKAQIFRQWKGRCAGKAQYYMSLAAVSGGWSQSSVLCTQNYCHFPPALLWEQKQICSPLRRTICSLSTPMKASKCHYLC